MPASENKISDFQLPASTGITLKLDSFLEKVPFVLVFMPQSSSPEALRLLTTLSEKHDEFGQERSQLLVVVKETARTTRDLADGLKLTMPILADASGSMFRDNDVDTAGSENVVVVADKHGELVRRFEPFAAQGAPGPEIDSLLYTVRAIGSGALASDG